MILETDKIGEIGSVALLKNAWDIIKYEALTVSHYSTISNSVEMKFILTINFSAVNLES